MCFICLEWFVMNLKERKIYEKRRYDILKMENYGNH